MKEKITQLELFLKGSPLYGGIRIAVAILTPLLFLNYINYFEFAPSVVLGTFLNAPSDIPGSVKRKVNAILISIGLTVVITAIILFSKPFPPVLMLMLIVISFTVSLISVYGFRASLVSFSGLMAMLIAFSLEIKTPSEIFLHLALMGVGGFWYLIISFVFQKIAPKKEQNQLLSDTLLLISDYLKLRAKLLLSTQNRDELLKQTFVLQNLINEKHETLRESLLTGRKKSGRSHHEEKQLLIFMSSINIFELIEAKHLDYKTIDEIFGKHKKILKASKKLNEIMGDYLTNLSELLIQKDKIPSKEILINALSDANNSIIKYIDTVKLPAAREGALVLKNLYDYQEQLLQEILAIRRVLVNGIDTVNVSFKKQDSSPFLTQQDYHVNTLIQNISFQSPLFRHSLRITIALVFAYLLGLVLNMQNNYWILLTIIVIMRPSYGLTRERSKDRIIGTLIGAAIAAGIVLLTQSFVVYSILAIVALILSFSLIQQNYKFAAALITISIVFVYSLTNPNAFEVIQFRVVDTIIGAVIAVIANYLILPSWEAVTLKKVLLNALKMNRKYLLATQKLYQDPTIHTLSYKLARKEAFLATSNLNSSFQRLTQDPKSKQKEFQLIYEIVTLHHTMISAIASIGSFIFNHQTTPASIEFNSLVKKISDTLQHSIDLLEQKDIEHKVTSDTIEDAHKKLLYKYQELSSLRDKNIQQGKTELDTETLHGLQEAYLIANHMSWLKSLSENLKKTTESYLSVISVK